MSEQQGLFHPKQLWSYDAESGVLAATHAGDKVLAADGGAEHTNGVFVSLVLRKDAEAARLHMHWTVNADGTIAMRHYPNRVLTEQADSEKGAVCLDVSFTFCVLPLLFVVCCELSLSAYRFSCCFKGVRLGESGR